MGIAGETSGPRGRSIRAVLAALLLLGLSACSRAPAEQRLRDSMAALQQAIESREVGEALQHVSEDFIGTDGLDRSGVRNVLRLQVLRHQSLGLSLGPATIELQDLRASVRFTAVATGGSGSLLPASARVWEVETAWRDESGDWRLISAEWR